MVLRDKDIDITDMSEFEDINDYFLDKFKSWSV